MTARKPHAYSKGEYPNTLVGTSTAGHSFLFDEVDLPLVDKHTWWRDRDGYFTAGTMVRKAGRVVKTFNFKLHRLICGAKSGQIVDHINGKPWDNRRSNLRVCSQSINLLNRETTVYYVPHLDKWKAVVGYKGKQYHIGVFADKNEAQMAKRNVTKMLLSILGDDK